MKKSDIKTIFGNIFLLAALLAAVPLAAQNFSAVGLHVLDEKKSEDQVTLTLKSSSGLTFGLRHDGTLSDAHLEKVSRFIQIVSDLKSIKPIKIEVTFFQKQLDFLLVPEFYRIGDLDVLPYLPAGLSFSSLDTLQYNFRLKVDNLFVRIKGDFSREDELNAKVVEAVKNPHAYIRKRDPEYFLSKLDSLQEQLDKQQKRTSELEQKNAAMLDVMEVMRRGIMTLDNEGFFSGFKEIPKAKVDFVVNLKRANPAINREQLEKKLKDQKMEISSKELTIILALFFNEFPK